MKTRYLITGDLNGLNYYAKISDYKSGFIPSFQWEGLTDNATKFYSHKLASDMLRQIEGKSKIPMEIKEIKID